MEEQDNAKIESMTLEDFKNMVEGENNTFEFIIKCKKCGSEKIAFEIDGKDISTYGGCDTCGFGSVGNCEVVALFKCKDCGNAFEIHREAEEKD